MWVFTVARFGHQRVAKCDLFRQLNCAAIIINGVHIVTEIARNRRIVRRDVLKSLRSQATTFPRCHSVVSDQLTDALVVVWIHHNQDIWMVFGRCPGHCRAADVNILQGFGQRYALSPNSFDEWIEIVHDDINVSDAKLRHLANVIFVVAYPKQSPVNVRMQSLDASVHYLWRTGKFGYLNNADTSGAQLGCGSAGGNDLVIAVDEQLGETYQPASVVRAQQSDFSTRIGHITPLVGQSESQPLRHDDPHHSTRSPAPSYSIVSPITQASSISANRDSASLRATQTTMPTPILKTLNISSVSMLPCSWM